MNLSTSESTAADALPRQNVRARSREVAKAIRAFIEDGITSGRLQPGEKLPTERELALQFGGGRNTVRQTLVALEREGKIIRHVGRGTFLAETAGNSIAGSLERIGRAASPAEVMELRMALEPLLVEHAVRRANPQQIDFMVHCLRKAEDAGSLEEFEHWDDMLHRTIAEASRNSMFVSIAEMISAVRRQSEWGKLKETTLNPENRRQHMEEHERIVAAVRERDVAAARHEMESHLRHIQAGMFGA